MAVQAGDTAVAIQTRMNPRQTLAAGIVGMADLDVSTRHRGNQTVFRRKQRFHLSRMVIELEFLRLCRSL